MIYYDFKNYEGFKELFGMVEHGNGVKSRKNKILLAYYKDRNALRAHINAKMMSEHEKECMTMHERAARCCRLPESMAELKHRITTMLQGGSVGRHRLWLNGRTYYSNEYKTDDMNGLCEDGTANAIRYYNVERERVFKMKAGKMFNHIVSCYPAVAALPEQVLRWYSEEWVGEWIAYASENLSDGGYTLHVDDNFRGIYSSSCCKGSFGSCMTNRDTWSFYRDSVDAKAAYLTDADGLIVARCIIYTEVHDSETEGTLSLAERQYATGGDEMLKRMLVNALYRDGHIDGHKVIGAGCSDSKDFVQKSGESLRSHDLWIPCNLDEDDTVSYQDSFKYYNQNRCKAYNDSDYDYDYNLATTEGSINGNREYNDYNEEYIPRDEAYYVDTRGDYFWSNQVVDANVWNGSNFYTEYCFVDDCIEIDGEYYYAGRYAEDPEDNGIYCCPECGEYFIEGNYSELTEEHYCCSGCLEDAEDSYKKDHWYWCEYDEDYVQDSDDRIEAQAYSCGEYVTTTISRDTLNELLSDGAAVDFDGAYYIDDLNEQGIPVHLFEEICAVA